MNTGLRAIPTDAPLSAKGNWLHVVSRGEELEHEFKLADGTTRKIIEVRDNVAIARMRDHFNQLKARAGFAGLLLDFDHFSSDTKLPTEAAGWLMDVREVPDGLEYQVDFSDVGLAAVNGKRYKFASSVSDPGNGEVEIIGRNRIRPVAINRAALTNDPRSKRLRPFGQQFLNSAAHGVQAGNSGEEPQGERSMDYKAMLMKLLALPAEATDDQIQSACAAHDQEYKSRGEKVTQQTAQIQTLTAGLVETDLETFKGVIKDRDGVKTQLMQNREGTLVVLRGLATEGGKLLNRADGKPPSEDDQRRKDADREAYVTQVMQTHKLTSRSSAIDWARSLRPDLF